MKQPQCFNLVSFLYGVYLRRHFQFGLQCAQEDTILQILEQYSAAGDLSNEIGVSTTSSFFNNAARLQPLNRFSLCLRLSENSIQQIQTYTIFTLDIPFLA